jgi:pimeloyl-ACP methyl ester carboxylesterase
MILNSIEAGQGPPVVLLHGLFGAAKNLGVIARALSRRARVISLDARNHGDSGHDAAMSYEIMAGDVAETMAAAGIGRATVIGHSMGGKTAMMLAVTRPELVARVAVLDIAPVAYDHGYDGYVAGMRAIAPAADLTRHEADRRLADYVPEPPFRAFLLNNLILGARPRWRLGLEEIAGAMPDLLGWRPPAGARAYEGPACFIRGADSHYVRADGLEAVKTWFPHAGVTTIEDAGHWLHAEQPALVIAALEACLA